MGGTLWHAWWKDAICVAMHLLCYFIACCWAAMSAWLGCSVRIAIQISVCIAIMFCWTVTSVPEMSVKLEYGARIAVTVLLWSALSSCDIKFALESWDIWLTLTFAFVGCDIFIAVWWHLHCFGPWHLHRQAVTSALVCGNICSVRLCDAALFCLQCWAVVSAS